jgi:hypothetical protein
MTVQVSGPATPSRGFTAPGDGEFHPIELALTQDYTDVTCAVCGPLDHAGSGPWHAIAHGADHAIATGHTVLERHVRLTVISERAGGTER